LLKEEQALQHSTPELYAENLKLLEALWQVWARQGLQLSAQDWQRPTRCTGWDVHALYTHVARGVDWLSTFLGQPSTKPLDFESAAAYFAHFRSYQAEAATDNSRRVLALATQTSPDALVKQFQAVAGTVIAQALTQADAVVESFIGTIWLSDYVVTRLVEATVHLLDLQEALGVSIPLPNLALEHCAAVLLQLTPLPDFIEVATGRSAAKLFPVLV
jgi:uncharacterized protein (TIGR03083 family)